VLPLKRPDQTSYRADCRSSRSNLRTISVPQHGSQKPYRNATVRRPFSWFVLSSRHGKLA